jgi:hypothetical protein
MEVKKASKGGSSSFAGFLEFVGGSKMCKPNRTAGAKE